MKLFFRKKYSESKGENKWELHLHDLRQQVALSINEANVSPDPKIQTIYINI